MTGLSDFIGKDLMMDVPRLMKLTDEEFASALLEESKAYMENHGFFPSCRECEVQIQKPEHLVRYFETNWHDACFIEMYEREKNGHHLTDSQREYFDRVLEMVKARNKKEFDFTI